MGVVKLQRGVQLPAGFKASVQQGIVTVVGPNGKQVSKSFNLAFVSVKASDGSIVVEAKHGTKRVNAILTTTATHIENAVSGLQKEYVYKLAVVYSHFPINVSVKGNTVEVKNFVGEKNPRIAQIRPGVTVEAKGKEIIVRGHDKDAAGQTAANLEGATRIRNKDRRVFQDGIFIVEKAAQESAK
ncbi:MAG: 50S ribosomal protein L6 [Candidatus Diapherotrites archaeon]|nr:50S ribosomal protein L6 [Candidatus Diapherotrites archaeon]